jgi:hypothetical protein
MTDSSSDSLSSARSALPDAVRVQILATEHWSLLATRSMTWNEIFTRASMFLTTLSAAVVALALVAQATDFDHNFRTFAFVVLPAVLLLGVGTLIRLGDALTEDAWMVLGMNRLRHAYLEIAPDLEPYFITGHHDDFSGLLQTFGPNAGIRASRILSATPVIVALIDAMIVGVLVALVVAAFTERAVAYVTAGMFAAMVMGVLLVGVFPFHEIKRQRASYLPRFPRES